MMTPNPEYPLRVFIFDIHANGGSSGYSGFGRGNLKDTKVVGFDYNFTCGEPFLPTERNEFYQARWKKQDQKLELLMLKVGTEHDLKCTLNVALKSGPYVRSGNAGSTSSKSQSTTPQN